MNQAEHDMLVIDAQDGSRLALDALVRQHHRDLLRFAYSLCRDVSLSQDAVQDAWIRIAVVLEIPSGTVKSRLHRARVQLKQHFEGENDEH